MRQAAYILLCFATILHCLGIDHQRFTHKFRGLNTRLTGVEEAHVVKPVLL